MLLTAALSPAVRLATDTGQNPVSMLIVIVAVPALLGLGAYLLPPFVTRRSAVTWRDVAVLCGTAALAVYAYGVLCCLRLESAYHACMIERYGRPEMPGTPPLTSNHDSLIPVSSTCTWADGRTLDFVPWVVNPAVVVLLLAAVASGAVAVRRRAEAGRRAE
ncbi:hypothetical protein [Streptomyces sp. NPDC020681]|uniref:hypothetical protein n=1 Tax=Streptomyces sp. NPDC020681 TaxID=3365083 RepID=UPI0037A025A9